MCVACFSGGFTPSLSMNSRMWTQCSVNWPTCWASRPSGRADTTRLMLVGDPKQSIYRFRRADVTVWTAVQRDFRDKGLGAVVTLEENYRSVAPILDFVDAVIGPILDQPAQRRGSCRLRGPVRAGSRDADGWAFRPRRGVDCRAPGCR